MPNFIEGHVSVLVLSVLGVEDNLTEQLSSLLQSSQFINHGTIKYQGNLSCDDASIPVALLGCHLLVTRNINILKRFEMIMLPFDPSLEESVDNAKAYLRLISSQKCLHKCVVMANIASPSSVSQAYDKKSLLQLLNISGSNDVELVILSPENAAEANIQARRNAKAQELFKKDYSDQLNRGQKIAAELFADNDLPDFPIEKVEAVFARRVAQAHRLSPQSSRGAGALFDSRKSHDGKSTGVVIAPASMKPSWR